MPIVDPENGHLTVLNLFSTDAPEKQDRLIAAMREIVDAAAYPGWISSTVHSGLKQPGTANFIQWRSGEDLEARYAGEEFRHRTLPLFTEMTTAIRLLQTQVAFTQRHPSLSGVTEISPGRDDYTVIEIFGVTAGDQEGLVAALKEREPALLGTPGYRSHTVLQGNRAQGLDGSFVVAYSQWADEAAHESFRAGGRSAGGSADPVAIATSYDWNAYRVVHTRSAAQ